MFYAGLPHYQAASPDEKALVCAARELGWVFLSRTRNSLVVSELGITRQYHLLALLEFTSKRRRMSVLGENTNSFYPSFRWPDGAERQNPLLSKRLPNHEEGDCLV